MDDGDGYFGLALAGLLRFLLIRYRINLSFSGFRQVHFTRTKENPLTGWPDGFDGDEPRGGSVRDD